MAHLPSEAIGTCHEPFVGGGALFFALRSRIGQAVLSDMNVELMITYRMIQAHPQEVLAELHEHQRRYNKEYCQAVRRAYPPPDSDIALAAQFIYLNRTCYNSLYRGRYRNPAIADSVNLQAVSCALQGVTLRWQPFGRVAPGVNDFVYCDPPYDGTYDQYTPVRFDYTEQEKLERAAQA